MRHASWLELRGIKTKVKIKNLRAPHGCAYTVWVARKWQKKAAKARKDYYRWRETHFLLRDFRVAPGQNAWLRAVDEAQKAYPGTKGWLLSCSASEGGWGRWVGFGGVVYEGYQGVGGWMQMLPGTFRSMMHGYYLPAHGRSYPGAWIDLRERGFVVPASADSWYSPLGQALASAYGKLNGRGGEWHGAGC